MNKKIQSLLFTILTITGLSYSQIAKPITLKQTSFAIGLSLLASSITGVLVKKDCEKRKYSKQKSTQKGLLSGIILTTITLPVMLLILNK